jgi:hypothetical protein
MLALQLCLTSISSSAFNTLPSAHFSSSLALAEEINHNTSLKSLQILSPFLPTIKAIIVHSTLPIIMPVLNLYLFFKISSLLAATNFSICGDEHEYVIG